MGLICFFRFLDEGDGDDLLVFLIALGAGDDVFGTRKGICYPFFE